MPGVLLQVLDLDGILCDLAAQHLNLKLLRLDPGFLLIQIAPGVYQIST
jgi:hypothetical protein